MSVISQPIYLGFGRHRSIPKNQLTAMRISFLSRNWPQLCLMLRCWCHGAQVMKVLRFPLPLQNLQAGRFKLGCPSTAFAV